MNYAPEFWLSIASRFTFESDDLGETVCAERMPQQDGSIKWAVRESRRCLTKQLTWEWEPQPSSRTQEFLDSARFDSLEDAYEAYQEYKAKGPT